MGHRDTRRSCHTCRFQEVHSNVEPCIICKSWSKWIAKESNMSYIHDQLKGKSREFALGFEAGIRTFARWKNGVQYVGTHGTTLKSAIEEIDKYRERQ